MNGFAFAISFILFIGGIVLFGYAFDAGVALRAVVFLAGILAVVLALAIPFHVLKRADR